MSDAINNPGVVSASGNDQSDSQDGWAAQVQASQQDQASDQIQQAQGGQRTSHDARFLLGGLGIAAIVGLGALTIGAGSAAINSLPGSASGEQEKIQNSIDELQTQIYGGSNGNSGEWQQSLDDIRTAVGKASYDQDGLSKVHTKIDDLQKLITNAHTSNIVAIAQDLNADIRSAAGGGASDKLSSWEDRLSNIKTLAHQGQNYTKDQLDTIDATINGIQIQIDKAKKDSTLLGSAQNYVQSLSLGDMTKLAVSVGLQATALVAALNAANANPNVDQDLANLLGG